MKPFLVILGFVGVAIIGIPVVIVRSALIAIRIPFDLVDLYLAKALDRLLNSWGTP